MNARARQFGFTLLEVMIAMGILAVGAASILGIFVAAIQWQANRVEDNRITQIYNYARQHAEIAFNRFDPRSVKEGERPLPPAIKADLRPEARPHESPDPLIQDAAEKFPGYQYEIDFAENEFSVEGSSVVAQIRIYRLSGQVDESLLVTKEILTRSGTPVHEFWTSPSRDERDRKRADEASR